jgi:hypothetical protein
MKGQVRISHEAEPSGQEIEQEGFGDLVIEDLEKWAPTFVKNTKGAKTGEPLVRMHAPGNFIDPKDPKTQGHQENKDEAKNLELERQRLFRFFFLAGKGKNLVQGIAGGDEKEKSRPKGIRFFGLGHEDLAENSQPKGSENSKEGIGKAEMTGCFFHPIYVPALG